MKNLLIATYFSISNKLGIFQDILKLKYDEFSLEND